MSKIVPQFLDDVRAANKGACDWEIGRTVTNWFEAWCEVKGVKCISQATLNKHLRAQGIQFKRTMHGNYIKLLGRTAFGIYACSKYSCFPENSPKTYFKREEKLLRWRELLDDQEED